MKKRQLRKILKIVAKQINRGDFTKLKPVHFRIIDKAIANFIERKYLTEFRPWWYDNFERWNELNLTEEHLKFDERCHKELEEWTGINMDLYTEYFQKNHKKSA